jgi:hypothetical protein
VTAKNIYPILLLLILAAMLDTCTAAYRGPKRQFAAVAGAQMTISGQLEGKVAPTGKSGDMFSENKVTDPALLQTLLHAAPAHREFDIRFVERNGRLWRAVLTVRQGAAEGDYPFRVLQPEDDESEAPPYNVRIFKSAAARRASDPSFTVRLVGIEPWWLILAAFPPLAILMGMSWRNSRIEERRLRQLGIGTIYKLARRKDHWELVGGLGRDDGLQGGDPVYLLRPDRELLAQTAVDSVKADHFTARVELTVPVTPDCLVARQAMAPVS